jgi:hypothetical protein
MWRHRDVLVTFSHPPLAELHVDIALYDGSLAGIDPLANYVLPSDHLTAVLTGSAGLALHLASRLLE